LKEKNDDGQGDLKLICLVLL